MSNILYFPKDLWAEEASNMICTEIVNSTYVTNQQECEVKCLQALKCVGIFYSYKFDKGSLCGICKNDILVSARNEYGFYRRPGNMKYDEPKHLHTFYFY